MSTDPPKLSLERVLRQRLRAPAMASNETMDPAKFRSTMSTINQGNVMLAAARNLQAELLAEQGNEPRDPSRAVVDMHDLEQVRAWCGARRGCGLSVGGLPFG